MREEGERGFWGKAAGVEKCKSVLFPRDTFASSPSHLEKGARPLPHQERLTGAVPLRTPHSFYIQSMPPSLPQILSSLVLGRAQALVFLFFK